LTFEGGRGIWVISDKKYIYISLSLISREKKSCKEIPGEKKFLCLKKKFFIEYNSGKKIFHCCTKQEKKYISPAFWKKTSYPPKK